LLIVGAVAFCTVAAFVAAFPIAGLLIRVLRPIAAGLQQPWKELLPISPLLLVSLPWIAGIIVLPWLARRFAPKCPHCEHPITENMALHYLGATRRCMYCGRTVIR
jgi:hypothetical protein